jgi:hypothetical protein
VFHSGVSNLYLQILCLIYVLTDFILQGQRHPADVFLKLIIYEMQNS